MSDAEEVIIANATYHTNLLKTISDLSYVPQARKDQDSYIKDLEKQIEDGRKKISELEQKTKKERKEHETLRDSTARRFAHKLVGKKEAYKEKESKEEREYVEALEREMTEKDTQAACIRLLEEAKNVRSDLKTKHTQFESAQAELQALYNRTFDGPTEAFPEDDRLEYDLNAASREHESVQSRLNAESRAAELLARAVQAAQACHRHMSDALSYSRYDMWGGGSFADMMERNALRDAQVAASQAEMLVDQASRTSPHVARVPRVEIASGSLLSDVFFDNIFTDMAFHEKIKASASQVVALNQRLKNEREGARARTEAIGNELMVASRKLDDRRKELHAFRRATFESYAQQHPPPPGYASNPSSTSNLNLSRDLNNNASSEGMAVPPSFPAPFFEGGTSAASPPVPLTTSPPAMPEPQVPSSYQWGTRNPYAMAMAEQTRKMSE